MNATFEWNYIEDVIPEQLGVKGDVLCLCSDGKVREGDPECGDGYWYLHSCKSGNEKVLFWTPKPKARELFDQRRQLEKAQG